MSKTFSMNFHDLAVQVMKKLGVHEAGEQIEPEEIEDVRLAFNLMVKEWSALGLDIPWRETVTLFLSSGQQSYLLGASGDHATSTYVETTLSGAAANGDTTLSLTSTTGISANDHIGVTLDDGTIHWALFGGTSSITIALPSAAAAGNAVYAYTTKANRPQKIINVLRRDSSDTDTPVTLIGEIEYQSIARKTQTGPVNQVFYRQTIPNGTLFVWPCGTGKLVMITQALVDDVTAITDDLEFPVEWTNAVIWNLAAELAPDYGSMSAKDQITLYQRAVQKREDLFNYDVENASVIVSLER